MVMLDIEIPTYCYDCPCEDNGRCKITGDSVFDKRPFDCPFKEVKHAHWANGACTNCGVKQPVVTAYLRGDLVYQYQGELNYCPHCGAKMDEKEEV